MTEEEEENNNGAKFVIPQSMMGIVRGVDEEYDSDDINAVSSEFRNRVVDLGALVSNGNAAMHQYKDDEDDMGDGEYTGFMYGDESEWSRESVHGETEAYDPDYEED